MREIEVKPSRLMGLLLLGMAVLALVAVHLAAIPAVIQWVTYLVVVGLFAWGWKWARMTEKLRVTANGELQCQDKQGAWCAVEVLGDSLVSPLIIVLRYRTQDGRVRSWVLLPDSAPAEDLRRLRVSLRWASHTRSDTASRDAG